MHASRRLVGAAAVLLVGAARGEYSLHLLDLATYPLARCIDGSAGGMYIERGTDATRFIVHLQVRRTGCVWKAGHRYFVCGG